MSLISKENFPSYYVTHHQFGNTVVTILDPEYNVEDLIEHMIENDEISTQSIIDNLINMEDNTNLLDDDEQRYLKIDEYNNIIEISTDELDQEYFEKKKANPNTWLIKNIINHTNAVFNEFLEEFITNNPYISDETRKNITKKITNYFKENSKPKIPPSELEEKYQKGEESQISKKMKKQEEIKNKNYIKQKIKEIKEKANNEKEDLLLDLTDLDNEAIKEFKTLKKENGEKSTKFTNVKENPKEEKLKTFKKPQELFKDPRKQKRSLIEVSQPPQDLVVYSHKTYATKKQEEGKINNTKNDKKQIEMEQPKDVIIYNNKKENENSKKDKKQIVKEKEKSKEKEKENKKMNDNAQMLIDFANIVKEVNEYIEEKQKIIIATELYFTDHMNIIIKVLEKRGIEQSELINRANSLEEPLIQYLSENYEEEKLTNNNQQTLYIYSQK